MKESDIEYTSDNLQSNSGLIFTGHIFQQPYIINLLKTAGCSDEAPEGCYSDLDILLSGLGLLSLGHSDFEDIDQYRHDAFFPRPSASASCPRKRPCVSAWINSPVASAPHCSRRCNNPARIDECEAILSSNPHELAKGEPAYSPLFDKLFMPDLAEFESPEKFYHTYFHELSHWTGHQSRINRDIKNRFGDEKYSKEELIAEMSACFLAAHCGIVVEDLVENRAAYLRSWINALHGDARLLMTAASAAERAARFLLDGSAAASVEVDELFGNNLAEAAPFVIL